MRPGLDRRLDAPVDAALDRAPVATDLAGDLGHAEPLAVKLKDHEVLPRTDDRRSPDRLGAGSVICGKAGFAGASPGKAGQR